MLREELLDMVQESPTFAEAVSKRIKTFEQLTGLAPGEFMMDRMAAREMCGEGSLEHYMGCDDKRDGYCCRPQGHELPTAMDKFIKVLVRRAEVEAKDNLESILRLSDAEFSPAADPKYNATFELVTYQSRILTDKTTACRADMLRCEDPKNLFKELVKMQKVSGKSIQAAKYAQACMVRKETTLPKMAKRAAKKLAKKAMALVREAWRFRFLMLAALVVAEGMRPFAAELYSAGVDGTIAADLGGAFTTVMQGGFKHLACALLENSMVMMALVRFTMQRLLESSSAFVFTLQKSTDSKTIDNLRVALQKGAELHKTEATGLLYLGLGHYLADFWSALAAGACTTVAAEARAQVAGGAAMAAVRGLGQKSAAAIGKAADATVKAIAAAGPITAATTLTRDVATQRAILGLTEPMAPPIAPVVQGGRLHAPMYTSLGFGETTLGMDRVAEGSAEENLLGTWAMEAPLAAPTLDQEQALASASAPGGGDLAAPATAPGLPFIVGLRGGDHGGLRGSGGLGAEDGDEALADGHFAKRAMGKMGGSAKTPEQLAEEAAVSRTGADVSSQGASPGKGSRGVAGHLADSVHGATWASWVPEDDAVGAAGATAGDAATAPAAPSAQSVPGGPNNMVSTNIEPQRNQAFRMNFGPNVPTHATLNTFRRAAEIGGEAPTDGHLPKRAMGKLGGPAKDSGVPGDDAGSADGSTAGGTGAAPGTPPAQKTASGKATVVSKGAKAGVPSAQKSPASNPNMASKGAEPGDAAVSRNGADGGNEGAALGRNRGRVAGHFMDSVQDATWTSWVPGDDAASAEWSTAGGVGAAPGTPSAQKTAAGQSDVGSKGAAQGAPSMHKTPSGKPDRASEGSAPGAPPAQKAASGKPAVVTKGSKAGAPSAQSPGSNSNMASKGAEPGDAEVSRNGADGGSEGAALGRNRGRVAGHFMDSVQDATWTSWVPGDDAGSADGSTAGGAGAAPGTRAAQKAASGKSNMDSKGTAPGAPSAEKSPSGTPNVFSKRAAPGVPSAEKTPSGKPGSASKGTQPQRTQAPEQPAEDAAVSRIGADSGSHQGAAPAKTNRGPGGPLAGTVHHATYTSLVPDDDSAGAAGRAAGGAGAAPGAPPTQKAASGKPIASGTPSAQKAPAGKPDVVSADSEALAPASAKAAGDLAAPAWPPGLNFITGLRGGDGLATGSPDEAPTNGRRAKKTKDKNGALVKGPEEIAEGAAAGRLAADVGSSAGAAPGRGRRGAGGGFTGTVHGATFTSWVPEEETAGVSGQVAGSTNAAPRGAPSAQKAASGAPRAAPSAQKAAAGEPSAVSTDNEPFRLKAPQMNFGNGAADPAHAFGRFAAEGDGDGSVVRKAARMNFGPNVATHATLKAFQKAAENDEEGGNWGRGWMSNRKLVSFAEATDPQATFAVCRTAMRKTQGEGRLPTSHIFDSPDLMSDPVLDGGVFAEVGATSAQPWTSSVTALWVVSKCDLVAGMTEVAADASPFAKVLQVADIWMPLATVLAAALGSFPLFSGSAAVPVLEDEDEDGPAGMPSWMTGAKGDVAHGEHCGDTEACRTGVCHQGRCNDFAGGHIEGLGIAQVHSQTLQETTESLFQRVKRGTMVYLQDKGCDDLVEIVGKM